MGLKEVNSKPVNHPVPEMGGKDLPEFRFFQVEADRTGRLIRAVSKRFGEADNLTGEVNFKTTGINGPPLTSAAPEICVMNIFR